MVPEECKTTVDGRSFLHHDEPGNQDRIITWATENNLDILKNSPVILCDGTFWVTPTPFYQMYTFHSGVAIHKSLPMVYNLLTDKKKPTYIKLANILRESC